MEKATKLRLLAFMMELHAATEANIFNKSQRMWENRTLIDCKPFYEHIHISMLRTMQTGRRNGSDALRWLCGLADKHLVLLSLNASPLRNITVLDSNQLICWCRRYGFSSPGGVYMTREPNTGSIGTGTLRKSFDTDKTYDRNG